MPGPPAEELEGVLDGVTVLVGVGVIDTEGVLDGVLDTDGVTLGVTVLVGVGEGVGETVSHSTNPGDSTAFMPAVCTLK